MNHLHLFENLWVDGIITCMWSLHRNKLPNNSDEIQSHKPVIMVRLPSKINPENTQMQKGHFSCIHIYIHKLPLFAFVDAINRDQLLEYSTK